MRINILESSGLSKPKELIMYTVVLNSVQFFDFIYNSHTCFSYKVLYKRISTYRITDTSETFRKERREENVPTEVRRQCEGSLCDVLYHIKVSLGVVTTLGRMEVLETLSSIPSSCLRTCLSSAKTWAPRSTWPWWTIFRAEIFFFSFPPKGPLPLSKNNFFSRAPKGVDEVMTSNFNAKLL